MNINNYELNIEEDNHRIELIYQGNENIIIQQWKVNSDGGSDQHKITIPRDILEKFIQMIR